MEIYESGSGSRTYTVNVQKHMAKIKINLEFFLNFYNFILLGIKNFFSSLYQVYKHKYCIFQFF